jgi:menaquinone-dependent protoporphyrinogen IX oxidase
VPFKPVRLLIAYDNEGGRCGLVVPRMKQLLEERAFEVDVFEIGSGEADLEPYKGVVLGTPVTGLAIRNTGPTAKVVDFITSVEGLDEKKVALFCVYDVRPGDVFDRMKNLIYERGAEHVAEWPYWRMRPEDGDTILPAECMVRIRS